MVTRTVTGYTRGSRRVPGAPVEWEEFERLQRAVLWGPEDEAALQEAGTVLEPQLERLIDVWYGYLGSEPFLLEHFGAPGGQPDREYLAAVRARFAQWVRDTCSPPYDQAWLDYQFEIARRHHRTSKGATDQVQTTEQVPLRYLVASAYAFGATVRPFLEKGARGRDHAERMHQAWWKTILLQVALWTQPYAPHDW
jgi:hypothetical protein